MKRGKLYGVSVGPGDPSLMTLRAVSCIRQCGVLAAPRTADGNSLALKSGRALPEVKRLLRELGLAERSSLVIDCGLPTQRVFVNIDEATDESYFTTILIKP